MGRLEASGLGVFLRVLPFLHMGPVIVEAMWGRLCLNPELPSRQ